MNARQFKTLLNRLNDVKPRVLGADGKTLEESGRRADRRRGSLLWLLGGGGQTRWPAREQVVLARE